MPKYAEMSSNTVLDLTALLSEKQKESAKITTLKTGIILVQGIKTEAELKTLLKNEKG